jgi:hypothetical protein
VNYLLLVTIHQIIAFTWMQMFLTSLAIVRDRIWSNQFFLLHSVFCSGKKLFYSYNSILSICKLKKLKWKLKKIYFNMMGGYAASYFGWITSELIKKKH